MAKKQYNKIDLGIRSFLYSVISVITIILFTGFFICFFFLPLRHRHALVRVYLRFNLGLLKHLCRFKYVIEGVENIPKDETGVVMCKHQSAWETYYLPLLFHDTANIAKQELAWIPFFGWGLALSGPIFINRKKKSSAMQQIIKKGKQYLAQKRWIIVYPEGTRVPYGTVGHYRAGGARLAVSANTFVIPVAHNAGKHWPRRSFIKIPGTIYMIVGPRIDSAGKTPEEVLELTKSWIESTVKKIDARVDG